MPDEADKSTGDSRAKEGMNPLFPGAALGFRAWGVDGTSLVGITYTFFEWQPEVSKASCQNGHKAPHAQCSCGFHAYHELGSALSLPLGRPGIVGAIAGRGQAQVHASGFRCAEAQVLALLEPEEQAEPWMGRLTWVSRRRAKQLARRYRVPLFASTGDLLAYCRQIACGIPSTLRP